MAKETKKKSLKIGDVMPDGSVFAGISPDTNKPMYLLSTDAPLMMAFNKAAEYASKLDAYGHKDWRVPTEMELNVIWQNCDKGALKGTFNLTGSISSGGWYWSSTSDYKDNAMMQRFSDGRQANNFDCNGPNSNASVRCVRG